MKRILIKKRRSQEIDGRTKVISDIERHYVDSDKDFHSRHGVVRIDDLAKKTGTVVKSGNEDFTVLDADFMDHYRHIRRGAQIITFKDLGIIITNAGINRNSKIFESGAGSGAATVYLAMIAKKIVGYDNDERSLEIARENVKKFGLKNATINKGDVYDASGFKEKGFDVYLLDVPEPWRAIGTVKKVLKIGGMLVIYAPHVTQSQKTILELGDDFIVEKTVEVIEREWLIDDKRCRPQTKDHAHTAFLTFARRLA